MERTTIYLTEIQKFHLRRIIKHTGLQQSEIIRRALDDYIKAFYAEVRNSKDEDFSAND
ncbi:ribbon-helix-helix domain-containing protein [Candidatus Kaiserbacteria bacterium]|nr:ribbon-helix-helix domain-containing protein [Candidatus Kaiserbacteria bacterium]